MEVVRRVKRASGVKRVGHAGTLDPLATGVIPVCIGQATRVIEYLVDSPKAYTGRVRLGVSTDSYDALGEVDVVRDASSVTRSEVEAMLDRFRGTISQVPPMFSALKHNGRRLYELAREGIEVERKPREMEVHDIRLIGWEPPVVTLEVTCGKGFYMRSLAHDLGQALDCGGHLEALVRNRTGPFHIDSALALDKVEEVFAEGSWPDFLHPPDVVLGSMRALVLEPEHTDMVRNGRQIPAEMVGGDEADDERRRAYDEGGTFLAILRFDADRGYWQPEKVFHPR